MNLAKQLLMSSAYWVLNKTVVKALGIETAFFLSNMVEAESMMSDEEGWFYQTINTVETITGLSRYSQNKAIDQLSELGIVEQANRGIPMKRYFKINYENLNKLLCKSVTTKGVNNSHTRVRKTNNLECEKLTTSKERINKQRINKESTKQQQEKSSCSSSVEKDSTLDDEFGEIAKLYQICIGQTNSLTPAWIEGHLEEYGFEWTKNALIEAEERGSRNKAYVNKILSNWKANGGMKLGGKNNGGSNGSNGENKKDIKCEGDELYKRAIEKYGTEGIADEDIPF